MIHNGHEVGLQTLVIAFKGGTYLKVRAASTFVNDTMQQWRKFLKARFAKSKEEAMTIGPVYFTYFVKSAKTREEMEKAIADDPTYEKSIEWIVDFTEICGMQIANEPDVNSEEEKRKKNFDEYLDLTKQYLKNELKPESWKDENK